MARETNDPTTLCNAFGPADNLESRWEEVEIMRHSTTLGRGGD